MAHGGSSQFCAVLAKVSVSPIAAPALCNDYFLPSPSSSSNSLSQSSATTRSISNQNFRPSISSLMNRSTFLGTSMSKTGATCSVLHGTLGLELEVVPLHVDPLVEATEMRNASSRESSKPFLDNVQQGPSVSVVNMETYGKALKVFQKTHGCSVDSCWRNDISNGPIEITPSWTSPLQ